MVLAACSLVCTVFFVNKRDKGGQGMEKKCVYTEGREHIDILWKKRWNWWMLGVILMIVGFIAGYFYR
jgi:hypothetical protein